MTESTKAVFLSYASEDAEAARHICDALRAAGIEVWFDQSELRGGDAWDQQIRKQIKACALFVPVISKNAHARIEGYFRLEWKLAVDRSHLIAPDQAFLLPVAIDDTPQLDERIPDRFRDLQWSRLPAGNTPLAFVERVSRLLAHEESPESGQTAASHSPPRSTLASSSGPLRGGTARRRFGSALLVLAAVIAVGYFAVIKLWSAPYAAVGAHSAPSMVPGTAKTRSVIPEKSIAVLPFVDMSEKKDQEYFADGIAAEVIDLLAKIPGLKVIGRTSSFQFKGKSQDLRAIGTALGATYIVDGSVRKSADHLRVTAQLIDARDGSQRWSSTYEQMASDVVEVQDAIAANLVRALQLTVSSDFGSRASTKSPEAYDLYLRGLHALDQGSREALEQAAGIFQQALDLDPSFAPAALGLAWVYDFTGEEAWDSTSMDFERARKAADLAIRLDPRLGDAHAVRAEILMVHDWDWAGADREIKQAMDLGSGVEADQAAGRMAAVRGEWDQATQLFEKALAVDPLNAGLYFSLAWGVELRSGRFAQAESSLRRALEISPGIGTGRFLLGVSLLFQDRLDEALAVFKEETPDDGRYVGSAVVYHATGKKAESDAALKRAIELNGDAWPSAIARVYAFRGERDQAMRWLERAYSARDVDLYVIKDDPLMKNMEDDPRYRTFLRKMNYPE